VVSGRKCAGAGAFVLLLAALLAGCAAPEMRYVSVPLDCPERPELPTVSAEELDCLTPEAHARLVWRETLRRQYAEELEALCWSTHEGANAPAPAHLKRGK
jgi:hypothetical protein